MTAPSKVRPLTDDDLSSDRCDGEVVLTKAQARRLTDAIKLQLVQVWDAVVDAYKGRAWEALGYKSWDDYCTTEFPTSRLRLPREERTEVVSSLRESGLSLRAIEAATGISRPTIIKDLSSDQVVNSLPPEVDIDEVDADLVDDRSIPGGLTSTSPGQTDRVQDALARARKSPVIGMDGKTYQPPKPVPAERKSRRGPLPETAGAIRRDLARINNRLEKLLADDRFDRNREVIGNMIRPEVKFGLDVLERLQMKIVSPNYKAVLRADLGRDEGEDTPPRPLETVAGVLSVIVDYCARVDGFAPGEFDAEDVDAIFDSLDVIRGYIEPGLDRDEAEDRVAEEAQPQIGPDYIDTILPIFLQTFGPHRLERFDASERLRVTDAMKEALQKLEELSGGEET